MWVYIKNHEPNLYTVGFYSPAGEWESESDHSTQQLAAQRVNYLNGGRGKFPPILQEVCVTCGKKAEYVVNNQARCRKHFEKGKA